MQHLDAERLAALDHDAPTLDELAHLAACSACRTERDAYAALVQMAQQATHADAAADAPRLTSWEALSGALRDEGLLTSTGGITPIRTPAVARPIVQGESPRLGQSWARWARAAAAIALMASSAAVGRLTAGANDAGAMAEALTGALTGVPTGAAVAAQPVGNAPAYAPTYASIDEATTALSRAQNEYERASLWLASHDTTTRSSEVYRARLAALDQMMAASKAALRDAPQDPVLNHYFLAAYTAREATLQQLGGALPVDRTIETY